MLKVVALDGPGMTEARTTLRPGVGIGLPVACSISITAKVVVGSRLLGFSSLK